MRLRPFAFLFLAASLAAQSPATFKIGTWNLEFLGSEIPSHRNNLPPRDDTDFAKIGHKVKDLGVAVLAVQEVCGPEPLRKVAAGAGPTWRFVLGTSGGWDDGKTSQQIGFLYDTDKVDLLFAEELLQLPRERDGVPIFHRVPVTAAFRVKATGFDFRATTVHLKAGQKAPDEQKRRLEATELEHWFETLQATAGEDEDRVLLGDFNSTFGAEPETILEKGGALHYAHPKAPTPTIMHFADPIDQIVVGKGFGELREDTFTVDGDFDGLPKEEWRKTYSDHFPVTVEIVAPADEDPNATFTHGGDEQSLPPKNRPAVAYTPKPGEATAKPAPVPATATSPAAWPPPVGTEVHVQCIDGPVVGGRLTQALPAGPGGWVVVATDTGTRAIPWNRVQWVEVPGK